MESLLQLNIMKTV